MAGLFSNPLMLIALVLAAVLPIFNGKTVLQIVLDLIIPRPPQASMQAWQHWTNLAEQALARGDTDKAEDYASRAAREAAEYQAEEMKFAPAGILQWIMKLITGGAVGGMLPLIIIGAVIFLVMGGCPQDPPLAAPSATASEIEPLYTLTSLAGLPPIPIDPYEDELPPDDCPPCDAATSASLASAVARSSVNSPRRAPVRRLLSARPIRSFLASRPLAGLFRCRR